MKKKLFLIILVLALFTLCNISIICFKSKLEQKMKLQKNVEKFNIENKTDKNDFKKDDYVDLNPIKLGLYLSENGKRHLKTTYTCKWQYHKDISTFNIFYTQKEELENTAIRICYEMYLKNYDEDIVNQYRNGFHIHFSTTEGIIDKTILSPKAAEEFYDFLEIYLYDSFHRKEGEWYSHTIEDDFNENTTLTSIKLTAGKRIDEVTSDIELMAFSYDNNDFDEKGNYKGVSKYSITVKKSEN